MEKKYHLASQPIPEGFQIYEDRLEVMGVVPNKATALPFCRAKEQALELQLDPSNSHDRDAIMVIGKWPALFRKRREKIGHVPRDVAKRLADAEVAHLVAARLLKTYAGDDDFVEVLFQIIGPADAFARYAALSPAPLTAAKAKAQTRADGDAEIDLLAIIEAGEQQAKTEGWGVAPRPYLDLAKLYRKAKRRDDEIAILERYERQTKAPGALPAQLAERLAKLRER